MREIDKFILELDDYIFNDITVQDDYGAEELMHDLTDDEKFNQYNEAISPNIAKSILGSDFVDGVQDYRLCSDPTGMYVTYNSNGKEVSTKLLDKREEHHVEIPSIFWSEPKYRKNILTYILVAFCVFGVLFSIFMILLLKK